MFIDHIVIRVKAGDGGRGCVSFRREKFVPHGGPDGGDGGAGGHILFVASKDVMTLMDFRYKSFFKAKDGKHGKGRNKTGASGEDLTIPVPLGTQVYDDNGILLADFTSDAQKVIMVHGGSGGRGNGS